MSINLHKRPDCFSLLGCSRRACDLYELLNSVLGGTLSQLKHRIVPKVNQHLQVHYKSVQVMWRYQDGALLLLRFNLIAGEEILSSFCIFGVQIVYMYTCKHEVKATSISRVYYQLVRIKIEIYFLTALPYLTCELQQLLEVLDVRSLKFKL